MWTADLRNFEEKVVEVNWMCVRLERLQHMVYIALGYVLVQFDQFFVQGSVVDALVADTVEQNEYL